jgi:hypothetical protein
MRQVSSWRLALRFIVACGIILAMRSAAAATKLANLPVKEVTIFKDGHAFVLHRGQAAVDADGAVRIDTLPAPVIGTFWPFSADQQAKLRGVAAGKERVRVPQTALNVRELLVANVGSRVIIHESKDRLYQAKIVGIPQRETDELAARDPGTGHPLQPQAGELILLETDEGTRTVKLESITEVTFVDPLKTSAEVDEVRDVLTLELDWRNQPRRETADVGMTYLQKGLRWIPQYRVTLQPDGNALVELQATIINELTDLEGVTTHLVIGVPTFQFQETLDPLALDRTVNQLSIYFQKPQPGGRGGYDGQYLSNAIMMQTQISRMGEHRGDGGGGEEQPGIAPELGASDDDLFLFSLENLTLRHGGRMTLPVGQWTVRYEDLYRLRLPFAPPQELRQYFDSQRQAELAALQNRPKVLHIARLKNSSDVPFTTAPALLMQDGRILAQGMMTYTSTGSSVDLEITAAVNLPVFFEDVETGRVPDAKRLRDSSYQQVNLAGTVSVSNYQSKPVRIEIERQLLGTADMASHDGAITQPGWHNDLETWSGTAGYPNWWFSDSWPWWWHHLNSLSRIRWTLEIPAGKQVDLTYNWHYFWG